MQIQTQGHGFEPKRYVNAGVGINDVFFSDGDYDAVIDVVEKELRLKRV